MSLAAINDWLSGPDTKPQPNPIAIAFFSPVAIRTFLRDIRNAAHEDDVIEREGRLDREALAESEAVS